MKRHIILVSITLFCFTAKGQSSGEQRESFFRDALLNPKNIRELIMSYKRYENSKKFRELYHIYKIVSPIIEGEKKSLEALKVQIENYDSSNSLALFELLKTTILHLELPDITANNIILSNMLTIRQKGNLSETEILKLDETIFIVSDILMNEYLNDSYRYYSSLNLESQEDRNLQFNHETIYIQFSVALMRYSIGGYTPNQRVDLSEKQAYIRIFKYSFINNLSSEKQEYIDNYGAFIFTKNSAFPQFITLGLASELEGEYYKEYLERYTDLHTPEPLNSDSSYFKFWQSIQLQLGDIDQVYIKPFGVYDAISLESLAINDSTFLMDKIRLSVQSMINNEMNYDYLEKYPRDNKSSFELFGYPNYNISPDSLKHTSFTGSNTNLTTEQKKLLDWIKNPIDTPYPNIRPFEFNDDVGKIKNLGWTIHETLVLGELLRSKGLAGRVFLDSFSNEFNLKKIESPKILHLATHTSFPNSNFYTPVAYDSMIKIYTNNEFKLYLSGAWQNLIWGEILSTNFNLLENEFNRASDLMADLITKEMSHLSTPDRLSYITSLMNSDTLMQWTQNSFKKYTKKAREIDNWSEQFPETDGSLTESEIPQLNLRGTDLVYISSCGPQSIYNNFYLTEKIAKAFTNAGAKSVMACKWPITDEAAAVFTLIFYENWLNGKSKSDALLSAKKRLRSLPGFEHPYFWGGWTIYGKQN